MKRRTSRGILLSDSLGGLIKYMRHNMSNLQSMTVDTYADGSGYLSVHFKDRVYGINFASHRVLTDHFLKARRSWRGLTYRVWLYNAEYHRTHNYIVEL